MYRTLYHWVNIHFQIIIIISILGMISLTVLSSIKRLKRLVNGLFILTAIIYILALLYVTLGLRVYSLDYVYNLTPFWTYYDIILIGKNYLLWENIANIVMFLPLGMFFENFAGRKLHWHGSVFAGMLFSTGIELIQLVTKRGFCDIDDVIHNTFGVMLGYFLTCGIRLAIQYNICRRKTGN